MHFTKTDLSFPLSLLSNGYVTPSNSNAFSDWMRMCHLSWFKTHRAVLSIMLKILEILVENQIERSVLVSSDHSMQDDLRRWSTYFGWNISTEIFCSTFDNLVHSPYREFRKEIIMVGAIPLGPVCSEYVVPFSSGIPTGL